MKRFKPSRRTRILTQTLGQSRWKSSTSLHMNKSSVRTWLYYKNIRFDDWTTTAVVPIQYQSCDTQLNNPVDMDAVTAGNQSPMTFNTQAELWGFYLVDRGLVKMEWTPLNVQATGSTQVAKYMTLSWFDTAPTSDALMTSFAAAAPSINVNNIKERFKQVAYSQIRTYERSFQQVAKFKVSRSWNLSSLMGYKATWETNVLNPANPVTVGLGFQFYGVANTAPVAPIAAWYHHFVVINLGALTAPVGALWPVNDNTRGQFNQDVAMYTKFYNPITYVTVLDI